MCLVLCFIWNNCKDKLAGVNFHNIIQMILVVDRYQINLTPSYQLPLYLSIKLAVFVLNGMYSNQPIWNSGLNSSLHDDSKSVIGLLCPWLRVIDLLTKKSIRAIFLFGACLSILVLESCNVGILYLRW